MERNRWEAAIRCLEIAVHPNTAEDEAVAAVNGFRRLGGGKSLREICAEFAGGSDGAPGSAEWTEALARLSRENLDLRRRLETAENGHLVASRRVEETEQRVRDLGEALTAAQGRATAAEERHGELSAAHRQMTDALRREVSALRQTLEQGGRAQEGKPLGGTARGFDELLAEARQGRSAVDVAPASKTPKEHASWRTVARPFDGAWTA